jgi:hypothetical protein
MKGGLMLVAANRLFDVLDGPLFVASLVRQASDEVKRIGLLGAGLEDLPVEPLCVLQPAGTVKLQGRPQGLITHGHKHHYGGAAAGRATKVEGIR